MKFINDSDTFATVVLACFYFLLKKLNLTKMQNYGNITVRNIFGGIIMNITIKSFRSGKNMEKKLKMLYNTAFPAEERAPFHMLMSRVKNGKAEMLTAFDGDEFIGFAYMVCHEDVVYLFYLAVKESKRGMGYGSLIIAGVKKKYHGKRIFLAREQLDKSAPNYSQRVSRREFYLRRGFKDQPLLIQEASVVYDVMSIGGYIHPDEYDSLIKSWSGKLIGMFVKMYMIGTEPVDE